MFIGNPYKYIKGLYTLPSKISSQLFLLQLVKSKACSKFCYQTFIIIAFELIFSICKFSNRNFLVTCEIILYRHHCLIVENNFLVSYHQTVCFKVEDFISVKYIHNSQYHLCRYLYPNQSNGGQDLVEKLIKKLTVSQMGQRKTQLV